MEGLVIGCAVKSAATTKPSDFLPHRAVEQEKVSLASRTPIGFQHARYPRNSHFGIIGYLKQQEAQMSREESEDNTIYKVVVNHEEQYSIWPADRENALGWNDAGKSGAE